MTARIVAFTESVLRELSVCVNTEQVFQALQVLRNPCSKVIRSCFPSEPGLLKIECEWSEPASIRRPHAFQACALPTELSDRSRDPSGKTARVGPVSYED